jgi:hypothetical protein
VFSTGGRPGARALTLKAFTGLLLTLPGDSLEGHVRRHDFSCWLDDVFRDHPLAAHVRRIEAGIRTDGIREVVEAIAQAIRARYETTSEREPLGLA